MAETNTNIASLPELDKVNVKGTLYQMVDRSARETLTNIDEYLGNLDNHLTTIPEEDILSVVHQ